MAGEPGARPSRRGARCADRPDAGDDEGAARGQARAIDARRDLDAAPVERVLDITGGHPYATQELCYALWEEPSTDVGAALASVLRSENAQFALVWDQREDPARRIRIAEPFLAEWILVNAV